MRLARLATGVPRPPTSTPSSSSPALSVKPERSRAAGTLLMTWLASRAAQYSRPASSFRSRASTASSRARFPAKTKKATKVSSRRKSAFSSVFRSSASSTGTIAASSKYQGSRRNTARRQRAKSPR